MLTDIEKVAEKYPQSHWTEESLMAAGNYYWVLLDRTKAAHYYERVLENFPSGKNTTTPSGASPGLHILTVSRTPTTR